MSIDLSKIATEAESFLGLLPTVTALVTGIAAVSPAGTQFSQVLNDAKAGLTATMGIVGAVEADIEAVWPHFVSILTALEKAFGAFKTGTASAPTSGQ